MTRPAIRLRMNGLPQATGEAAALLIHCALRFCAEPETFPVFQAHALTENAETDWVVQIMRKASPELLRLTGEMIASGVVADYGEAGVAS